MTVLLLAAMSKERESLARVLSGARRRVRAGREFVAGRAGGNLVVVAETGIGKANAAAGLAEAALAWKPDAVVSSGVAGGLAPEVRPMDVVVATRVAYHDVWCGPGNAPGQIQGEPASFPCDARLLRVARAVARGASRKPGGPKFFFGPLASGDEFVETAARCRAILAKVPGAVAVDMESAALAQTCRRYGLPFVSFRVASDNPADGRNGPAEYENFWRDLALRSFGAVESFLSALPEALPAAAARRGKGRSR